MARKSRRESLTPELTPLIDVVFLLLIFFLVSSVFKKEELALLLQLPTAEQGNGGKTQNKNLVIELTGAEVAIDGKRIPIDELGASLKGKDAKTIVQLRVDGKVAYERLVKVLDVLQKNKLENISLITEKEAK